MWKSVGGTRCSYPHCMLHLKDCLKLKKQVNRDFKYIYVIIKQLNRNNASWELQTHGFSCPKQDGKVSKKHTDIPLPLKISLNPESVLLSHLCSHPELDFLFSTGSFWSVAPFLCHLRSPQDPHNPWQGSLGVSVLAPCRPTDKWKLQYLSDCVYLMT